MQTDRKVRLVADESFKYEGRQLRPGYPFEANEDDVADILTMGHAHRQDSIVPYQTRAMVSREAEPISATQAKQQLATKPAVKRSYVKSGKYKRKDMRAED